MNYRDLAGGIFWLVVALFACKESYQLSVGGFHAPGSGFVGFWAGLLLAVLSSILAVSSFLGKGGKRSIGELFRGVRWQKALLVVVLLFAYALLFHLGGFLPTTLCLMLVLLWMGGFRPWTCIGGSVLIVFCSYLLFEIVLKVNFPKGVIGF